MRVKVKVAGSRIVIGSPKKYIASVHLCVYVYHVGTPMWVHTRDTNLLNLSAPHKKKKNKEMEQNNLFGWNCSKMSCAVTSHKMRKDPWVYCSCNFLFKQDGYHPHSQQCWGVCAPFREDLNKTWKLTQSLLRCMNINVTSDRVEWQSGKYQFIMSFGLGQTILLWTYLMFSSSICAWLVCIFSVEQTWRQWSYLQQTP